MSVPEISPAELRAALAGPPEKRPLLLDVRQPEEYAVVALGGAVLIPLRELPGRIGEVPATATEVVVYCHHGMRSLQGTQLLVARGLNARSLTGGIDAYARIVDPSLRRY